jgi:hypothetical protein
VPGTYLVSLIATGAGGSDTVTLNNYITVYPYPPPQAIFQSGDTLFANQGAASYQWYFNSILIPGATDYFYVATQDGDYNLIAADQNGCEVETVIFGVATSINTIDGIRQTIVIYPNPVKDELIVNLTAKHQGPVIPAIYTMQGERIYSGSSCQLCAVDVSSFPPGIYYIELKNETSVYRSRFIRE